MESQTSNTAGDQIAQAPTFDQNVVEQQLAKLKLEQNPVMAAVMGLAAAVLCAAIWTLTAVISERVYGLVVIGVGLGVGYSVRHFGKGYDKIYGIMGAVLSLFACILGNFLTFIFLSAYTNEISVLAILPTLSFDVIISVMADTFEIIDIFIYGIAAYMGYKVSINSLAEENAELSSEQDSSKIS